MEWLVDRTWDGHAAETGEIVLVRARLGTLGLRVRVEAPYHGDLPPAGPPGPTEGLWEHEVVELFIVGRGGDYLEIELGPHGHHLALRLRAPRQVTARGLPVDYTAAIRGRRWSGEALVAPVLLPAAPERANAFAIHGAAPRRYLAAAPTGGERPDFHRIETFPGVVL